MCFCLEITEFLFLSPSQPDPELLAKSLQWNLPHTLTLGDGLWSAWGNQYIPSSSSWLSLSHPLHQGWPGNPSLRHPVHDKPLETMLDHALINWRESWNFCWELQTLTHFLRWAWWHLGWLWPPGESLKLPGDVYVEAKDGSHLTKLSIPRSWWHWFSPEFLFFKLAWVWNFALLLHL